MILALQPSSCIAWTIVINCLPLFSLVQITSLFLVEGMQVFKHTRKFIGGRYEGRGKGALPNLITEMNVQAVCIINVCLHGPNNTSRPTWLHAACIPARNRDRGAASPLEAIVKWAARTWQMQTLVRGKRRTKSISKLCQKNISHKINVKYLGKKNWKQKRQHYRENIKKKNFFNWGHDAPCGAPFLITRCRARLLYRISKIRSIF